MFNLTNKAKDHFLNFFKSDDKDQSIKDFLSSRI